MCDEDAKSMMDSDENIRISLPKGNEMKKLIECPVCLEIPLPPIYLCRRGHIVCNFCQERTHVCPLCRDTYTDTRSFVAEGIVEQCLMKCKYRDHGCPAILKGGEMALHLKVCDYRPLRCAECNGAWILFGEYWNHLLTTHDINGISQTQAQVMYNFDFRGCENDIPRSAYLWPPYYFKCFDEKIFLLKVRGYENSIFAYVTFLGPREHTIKYRCRIEYLSRNDFTVCWEGRMNHFREDGILDILHQGRGLILPMSVISSNASIDVESVQSWTYRVQIMQAPEELNTLVPVPPTHIALGQATDQEMIHVMNK